MHNVDPEAINAQTRPESGYETRDVNLPILAKSSFWFFLFATAMIFLVIPAYVYFANQRGGVPARQDAKLTIPRGDNPLIQSGLAAKMDIVKLRREERRALSTYGWVDRAKGIAHVPIELAMRQIAQRGFGSEREGGASR